MTLEHPGTVANLSESSTFSVLFKQWLHQFRLHKRAMKRKATQDDNIHPLRLHREDTWISFHSCPLILMNKILSFFKCYFLDRNQQCALLNIHRTAGWGLLLNFPSFLVCLSSACWADPSWSPPGQPRRFLVNTVTLWRSGPFRFTPLLEHTRQLTFYYFFLNANPRCVTLLLCKHIAMKMTVGFCTDIDDAACWWATPKDSRVNRPCWILTSR